jgi:hypothetical protein
MLEIISIKEKEKDWGGGETMKRFPLLSFVGNVKSIVSP